MTRTEIALLVIVVGCLVFCALTWQDNRVMARKLAERDCVPTKSHVQLMAVCERVSYVNRRQEEVLKRAEEAIGIKWPDKVWSASGDPESRKNTGVGGGP